MVALIQLKVPDDKVGVCDWLMEQSPEVTANVLELSQIVYKMNQMMPGKNFYIAPTAGSGATCRSCANCPWMAMNNLENLLFCIEHKSNEIVVDGSIAAGAKKSLNKMLSFRKTT